jgi:hypothetical protein
VALAALREILIPFSERLVTLLAGWLCLLPQVYPKAALVYGSHQGAAIFQGTVEYA